MSLEVLVGVLVNAALCALLAFLAALLLRTRQSILGCLGAGLLGQGIGMWIAVAVRGTGWPCTLKLGAALVHLLWVLVGALLVLLVVRILQRRAHRGRSAEPGRAAQVSTCPRGVRRVRGVGAHARSQWCSARSERAPVPRAARPAT